MNNPEIQEILKDPAMQVILEQMQKDPTAAQEWVFFRIFYFTEFHTLMQQRSV